MTRRWLYQGELMPAAEFDGSGTLLARYIDGVTVKGTTSYKVIADNLGTPKLLVNATTGVAAQRLEIDEWGQVTADSNVGFQAFGFAGGIYDPDTGLVRFGARDLAAVPSLFGGQLYARKRQTTTLIRGEGDAVFAGGGAEDLLENPNFLQRVVELPLQPLVDRRGDHRDEKLKRERKHWSPLRPFRHPDSSCESPRICGRISAIAFWTPRGNGLPVGEPALVLTQVGNADPDDGFLTQSEASTMVLDADLVALVACDTAVGDLQRGEGVLGLGRAFQHAGARNVLVSLWPVAEEATVRLISNFFSHIRDGAVPSLALKQAKLDLRAHGFDHPFYWAPFILVGTSG